MAWSFGAAPFLIAGPCVVEPGDVLPRVAEALARVALGRGIPVCFKASFDKANRARLGAARGPGLEEGLRALERVRVVSGLPIITDIHEPAQAVPSAQVADALQIPAFLCRQTDLLVAAGGTGKPVNVKKGQWMQAEAMAGALEKIRSGGSQDLAVTERGTFFGYGDLVVDMRNFARLRAATGAPVIFDATHSVQQPGQGAAGSSAGQREFIPPLLAAAAVAGADGFFLEVHPEPARALSDPGTQWPLDLLDDLLDRTLDLWARSRGRALAPGMTADA
ncbi:MAG: 3-deoxy-8-phosphooctulonate synthase [Gemmatimonadales bacterium]